jgi:hypothetical protein
VWIYDTAGDAKTLDPTRYYRLLAWKAYAIGATGIGIWSFTDDGDAISSYNEYSALRPPYTPLYFGDTVTSSVQWEALREGMADYRLIKAVERLGTSAARSLLSEVRTLGSQPVLPLPWDAATVREPDRLRARMLALLQAG